MNTRRNKYDRKDSLELGETAESQFAELARQKGWQVTKAPGRRDRDEHWDFLIQKGKQKFRVDVKARKRISRRDAALQDHWVWIELHGVRKDDPGWLYGGKADLIAFETKDSFVIARRADLIALVEKLADLNCIVARPVDAKYKVYSRPGRPDRITLIELEKLRSITFQFFKTFQASKTWKVYDTVESWRLYDHPLPPFVEGQFYHIYNRGNNKEPIFFTEENYRYFLKQFDKYLSNYLDVYAFCLLRDHFHFLVRVKEHLPGLKDLEGLNRHPITQAFSNFFNAYTKAINKQETRTGSLFQKNFRRKVIDDEKYLCAAVLYIHHQPIHHQLCKKFEEFPWSSYSRILDTRHSKLKKQEVLAWFGCKEDFIQFHQTPLEANLPGLEDLEGISGA